MGGGDNRLTVGVYGATGYTGRLVARELLARGHAVVLAGRSPGELSRLAAELAAETPDGEASVCCAELHDDAALRTFMRDLDVVINCAGPFPETCPPVATAAVACGVHYVDVSSEQIAVRWLYERGDSMARDARVAVIPGFAFFSGISDLLAAIAAGDDPQDDPPIDEVLVAYAIRDWRASTATLQGRVKGVSHPWFEFVDGRIRETALQSGSFDFGGRIGRRRMTLYPTPEPFNIPRHVATSRVRTLLTTSSLLPAPFDRFFPLITAAVAFTLRSPARVFVEALLRRLWHAPKRGAMACDPTEFDVVVEVRSERSTRTVRARGRGIYDLTAPIVVAGAEQICKRRDLVGAHSPAEVVPDPRAFLRELAPYGFECGAVATASV